MTGQSSKELGAFLGVFTPTILTILGVIMFLRSGWVVGNLGLAKTIIIVLIANSITIITTLSFSSMATNIKVGGGGAYFIISRSLGLGVGAAIGLPLFLSQAVSVTLYSFGLAESLSIIWADLPIKLITVIIIFGITGLSYKGAALALKSQIPLLALVAISLAALAIGALTQERQTCFVLADNSGRIDFWFGFAVFFPAVTGVMAGLSLSGDLKKPERSIPLGAIAATLTGFAIYLMIPFLLDRGASPLLLQNEPLIWTKIAFLGFWLVLPGLWGAILSSAVGSTLGAPRTFQAVARDQLKKNRPGRIMAGEAGVKIGLLVTMLVALGSVYFDDLNAVAQVVTMFFLTVYGTVNVVAAIETLSGDPSWRPKFRIPWAVNLACGLACVWVMFLISPIASIVAIAVELLLWMFFVRREQRASWGDARRGVYEALFRWALIRISQRPMSARNWRPHMLVFVDDPVKRLDLIRFGCWFSQERGVVTVCELLIGDLLTDNFDLIKKRESIQKLLNDENLTVFAEVDVVNNVIEGITNVSQANGMAGMASNTILLGWPKDPDRLTEFIITMKRLEKLNKSVMIAKINPTHIFPREKRTRSVHVWWGGLKQNGDLMLLLAYLLTRNPEWRDAGLKIISIASNDFARDNTQRYLTNLVHDIRINAEIEVLMRPKEKAIRDIIQESSVNADVVFLGLASPEDGSEREYIERMEELAGDLPVVFFVKNSSLFVGQLMQPESLE